MAYTKADSYPLPLSGLLPITHGSYAGSPVATVSVFAVTVSWEAWEEESDPQALVPVIAAMVNNAAVRRMKCDGRDNGHLGLLDEYCEYSEVTASMPMTCPMRYGEYL